MKSDLGIFEDYTHKASDHLIYNRYEKWKSAINSF